MANGFSIADPNTDKRITNALNQSFDSIQQMIDAYTPQKTEQNFAILNYQGTIQKDKSIYTSVQADVETPIFCFYGNVLKYVGTLVGKTLTFTETLEIDNDGKKEPYKALIYQPFRIGVSRNPVQITKNSFYDGENKIQQEEQK